jgi:creatinine amidohydrolase
VPDAELMATANPEEVRQLMADGTGGGTYQRPDEDVMRVWQAGVEELRRLLEDGWPKGG